MPNANASNASDTQYQNANAFFSGYAAGASSPPALLTLTTLTSLQEPTQALQAAFKRCLHFRLTRLLFRLLFRCIQARQQCWWGHTTFR
jgi:hypothetical protein